MSEPEAAAEAEEIRMEIRGLMLDPTSNVPIVVLRDVDNNVFLPIWIGVFEANAIALRIENVVPPRPMTHDLLRSALELTGVKVQKVVISDLQDNTFFALIHVDRGGELFRIDARPSDAIALALRAEVPIFVLRPVLEKAKAVDLASAATDDEKLKKWLEEISPEDLGKYTM
jgi:bifunctional DNase/RNase